MDRKPDVHLFTNASGTIKARSERPITLNITTKTWTPENPDATYIPGMTITEQQRTELLDAAKPLMKWLNENAHPHCRVIVDQVSLELLQGIATGETFEFQKDYQCLGVPR